ncbi:hypothetical protein PTTG_08255, partial [Puccinia triticina 1-1 BBBD Race 1]
MSGFPQAHHHHHYAHAPPGSADDHPLPAGWIKEWDATHNAWYFVDTRQSAPVPTWTDPRHSAPAGAGDRGLMGSLGSMLSGKPAGQAPMGSHPAPPHGAYNNTAPGYPGAYTPQAPPMHHYNGGPGEASAYYNQPAPPAPYSSSAPPNAAKPAGGLGGLLAKIPGGGGGGGGSGGGGAGGGCWAKAARDGSAGPGPGRAAEEAEAED